MVSEEIAAPQDCPLGPDEAYREMVRAFGEVAAALSEQSDLDSLLHLIAERCCALTGVPRCSVYLRDETSGLFNGQVGHADHDIDALVKRLVAGSEADRFTREIVETKRPVVVANALDDPRPIRSTMRAWNVRSMLGVPMVLRSEVIGLVFLDVEHERWTFTASATEVTSAFADLAAAAIVQAQLTGDLRKSLATVARQNKLLRRATAVDERLGSLSLEGASFAEIAEAVADLTAKPCAIYDASYRTLATANPRWLDDPKAPTLPDASVWTRPDVASAVGEVLASRTGVLRRMPDAGLRHRFLVAPVVWREHEWGMMVIMEYGTQFAALDRHIARRAATSVALELSAEHRAARSEWDARAALLGELLRGNQDLVSVERRAQYLGLDLDSPRVLCLISHAEGEVATLPSANDLAAAVTEGTGQGVLAAGVHEGALLALDLDPDRPSREAIQDARARVEAALERLRPEVVMIAALSARCSGVADFLRGYGEAQQVLHCLTTLADTDRAHTLTADELGPARLLLASTDRLDAQRFSHNALGVLLTEADGMADLLETLYVFFDCSRSVRRSAQVLSLHENTIRYRLARVEEMTGLAVSSNSDDQLTVQFALLILRICGEGMPPRTVPSETAPSVVLEQLAPSIAS